jgi:diguanylate cyclase (GGDEF)-like protein
MRRVWLAGGAGVFVLFALNSMAPDSRWVGLVEDVAAMGAVTALWVGARRQPSSARRGWTWLAIAVTCWVVGDFVWDAYAFLDVARPDVSFADVCYLAGYPCAAAGVFTLIRTRRTQSLREAMLDACIVGASASIVAWQFLVMPVASDTSSWFTATIWSAYPIADAVLLTAVALLVFASAQRFASERFLVAALILVFVVDVLYAYLPTVGSFDVGRLDPLYPIAYALIAVAAWARADRSAERRNREPKRINTLRFLFLGTVLCAAATVAVGVAQRSSLTRVVDVLFAVVLCVLVVARFATSIRANERARDQLRFNATHDELTGLVNRVLLIDRVSHALERARRDRAEVAVLYIDLDRFKAVNDTLGHHVGDQVLSSVARRMQTTLRDSDTVARIGGDEFVVLCEAITTVEALRLAERLIAEIANPYLVGGREIHLTASLGIATSSHGEGEVDALVQDADTAMYDIKRQGGNGYQLCDALTRGQYQQRRDFEDALRRASATGELTLHYQPTVRPQDNAVVNFEALVRWERPDGSFVLPGDFIPVAEETGAIVQIGTWVIDQACNQLANWALDGITEPSISINVSAHQFRNQTVVHDLTRALVRTGADPARLTIEITESALLRDQDHVAQQLDQIRRQGVRIAIDDFGTGYSGLSYLHQLPIDIIKIDRTLTSQLDSDPAATVVLAGIIDLAHALGLETIAEGAETEHHVRVLTQLGCDQIQGYYYARPAPQPYADAIARHGLTPHTTRDARDFSR